jgi:hypothetical protein
VYKKVRLRLIVEVEVDQPHHWTPEKIESFIELHGCPGDDDLANGERTGCEFIAVVDPTPHIEACRYAVFESIVEFKRKAFEKTERVPCAETGTLTAFADCEVHHAEPWPFKKIVAAFVEQNGEPSVRKRANGDFGSEFVYPKDAANFRKFHDRLAILEIVNRDAHHRLRAAQLRDVGAEDSDNGEVANADFHKEFPAE